MTLNETRHRDAESRITSYVQAYFDLHAQWPKIANVCAHLRCSRNTAKPILARLSGAGKTTVASATIVMREDATIIQSAITCLKYSSIKANQHQRANSFTEENRIAIDNCFALLRHQVETEGKHCWLLTLNIPSISERAELAVAKTSKKVLRKFTSSMAIAYGVLHQLMIWERQLHNAERLHLHALITVEPDTEIPTHAELSKLWRNALPQAAFVDDDGVVCELESADVDVREFLDFSPRDRWKNCYLAKRASKKARDVSGISSLPAAWWHADARLRERAASAIHVIEIGAVKEYYATRIVDDLVSTVFPDCWRVRTNKKAGIYRRITGYEAQFTAPQLPAVTAALTAFADEAAKRPCCRSPASAKIIVTIAINPGGLISIANRRSQ